MRVLVLNPPVPDRALTNRDLMGGMGIDDAFGESLPGRFLALAKYNGIRLPVLSLGYATALLRAAGHQVWHIDLSRRDPTESGVLAQLVDWRPDWVVAATSFAFFASELQFLHQLHSAAGCKRLLLGETAGHFAAEVLQGGHAEAIALGDPEVAVQRLAQGLPLRNQQGLATAPGLEAGQDVWLGSAAYVPDIGALPWPDWSDLNLHDYGYHPLLRPRPFATILGSRGCPYACEFCPYPVAQGAPFRPRPVADVVAEVAFRARSQGVRALLFRDPTFSLDIARAKEIARGIRDLRVDLVWGIETRLDRLDDELIDLLAAAGCKSMTFGLDPLEDAVRVESHRKGYRPEVASARIARMHQRGIAAAGLFVVGLPEQTEAQLASNFAWIEAQSLSYVNYEVATVFPGTPMYHKAIRKGWISPIGLNDLLHGEPKLHYNGQISASNMRKLQDGALRRFYRRPQRLWHEVVHHNVGGNLRFLAGTAWQLFNHHAARNKAQRSHVRQTDPIAANASGQKAA